MRGLNYSVVFGFVCWLSLWKLASIVAHLAWIRFVAK